MSETRSSVHAREPQGAAAAKLPKPHGAVPNSVAHHAEQDTETSQKIDSVSANVSAKTEYSCVHCGTAERPLPAWNPVRAMLACPGCNHHYPASLCNGCGCPVVVCMQLVSEQLLLCCSRCDHTRKPATLLELFAPASNRCADSEVLHG